MLNLLNSPMSAVWLVGSLTLALLIAVLWQNRLPRLQQVAGGLLVSYITIALLLGAAEAYFRYIYTDSGWEFTYAHQNWKARYWQLNERGFRDQAWDEADFADKTTLAVLGDSFASGWGVTDPADRFSDVLADRLGEDYAVVNLAIPGLSTPQQLAQLRDNPPENPDIVLLQYFLNDIELASASIGRGWDTDFVQLPVAGSIAAQSYLGNFLYWRIYPLANPVNATFEGSYWQWQYETYDNFVIWDIHEQQLNDLIDYVEALDAALYVLIFPNMEDPVGSVPYVDRVKFVFEERGYTENVLTLNDVVASWDRPESPIVSPRDAHPSAAFHRHVGDLLYAEFFASRIDE